VTASTVTRDRTPDGIVIVSLEGEHDLATAETVRDGIADAADGAIVVDLRHTQFIDSSILGVFVSASRQAEEAGTGFAIVIDPSTNGAVSRVFDVTGLADILPTYDSLEDALAAVGGTEGAGV